MAKDILTIKLSYVCNKFKYRCLSIQEYTKVYTGATMFKDIRGSTRFIRFITTEKQVPQCSKKYGKSSARFVTSLQGSANTLT